VDEPFWSEDKEYLIATEGQAVGVCCDLIDHGNVKVTYQGHESIKRKFSFVFELPEINENTHKRFTVRQRFTASLHENSRLRPFLESWRGKPFAEPDIESLRALGPQELRNRFYGVCALLNIIHSDDGKWANIQSIMPLPREMKKIDVMDYRPREAAPEESESPF